MPQEHPTASETPGPPSNPLAELFDAWMRADEGQRARFALARATGLLQAVERRRPQMLHYYKPARCPHRDPDTQRLMLGDEPLAHGDPVEVLVAPCKLWIEGWIEHVEREEVEREHAEREDDERTPRLCLLLGDTVSRLPLHEELPLRRPADPDPELARIIARRIAVTGKR